MWKSQAFMNFLEETFWVKQVLKLHYVINHLLTKLTEAKI